MKNLLPFQVAGADFLSANYHALLADQPGLGKTLQAIQAAQNVAAQRLLVVCPASVRSSWSEHLFDFYQFHRPIEYDVISYNQAVEISKTYTGRGWDAIILDEAHFLKTPEAQRTQALFNNLTGLARRARWKWCLTGTPVLNRPRELFPVLKTLSPAFAGYTFATFTQKFCGAYWNGRERDTRGASNLQELASLLKPFMLRRTKREVFPGRKEPIIATIPLELTFEDRRAIWDEERIISNREAYLSPSTEKFGQLGDLARLLRVTGEAKVRPALAYIEDLLETADKLVVFFHHTEVGRALHARLWSRGYSPVVYQGGMSDAQKDKAKSQFMQEFGCRVFLAQIQAAGTGINGLQEVCSDCVFVEDTWVPGELEQAVDRMDRMRKDGSFADCVTARILHAPGTMESAVLKTRERKDGVIGRLLT